MLLETEPGSGCAIMEDRMLYARYSAETASVVCGFEYGEFSVPLLHTDFAGFIANLPGDYYIGETGDVAVSLDHTVMVLDSGGNVAEVHLGPGVVCEVPFPHTDFAGLLSAMNAAP